jgi:hypothetical protein
VDGLVIYRCVDWPAVTQHAQSNARWVERRDKVGENVREVLYVCGQALGETLRALSSSLKATTHMSPSGSVPLKSHLAKPLLLWLLTIGICAQLSRLVAPANPARLQPRMHASWLCR